MGSAPRLARVLTRQTPHPRRHPRSGPCRRDPPCEDDLRSLIRGEIMEAGAYEDRLDRARVVGQEQMFAVGVQLLSGQLTPQQAGDAYSVIAEALIETLLDAVQARYGGALPAPAVIAMGKLGGHETTAIFRCRLDHRLRRSAGAGAASVAALCAPDAKADQRACRRRRRKASFIRSICGFRPSGKAGPVAVRLDGFRLLSAQRSLDLGASGADPRAPHRRAARALRGACATISAMF